MKAFLLECYKSRRRFLPLIALSITAVTALWMAVGLGKMDDAERATGYAYCLYQAPLLNSIVLPVFLSMLVIRLCDMEHKGGAFKLLLTMERPESMFLAKFLLAGAYLLAAILLQAAAILLIGRLYGFTEPVPAIDLWLYVLSQWLVSLFLALIIQCLSLRIVNQFIPLVTGLVGGFLGLMAMFFSPWVMRFVPSAYYGLLSTVRMNWEPAARTIEFYYIDFSIWDCLIMTAAGVALFFIGRRHFAKREA